MALQDLTDRQAVLDAISEFDALGRDAFLARYGFGKAVSYFIEFEGGRYDSKAIAGAAHGYQHDQPLRAGVQTTRTRRHGLVDLCRRVVGG